MMDKARCRFCGGQGWFKCFSDDGRTSDQMCNQCNGHGFVWREPPIGARIPEHIPGQQQLPTGEA